MSEHGLHPAGVPSVRLGDLASGPIAHVGTGSVVNAIVDGALDGVRWSWWVGAEDRWHVPSDEPSTTDAHLEGAVGARTVVRIPSGDFVGRTTAARLDQLGAPAVLIELQNDSPVPVAIAFVVESDRPVAAGTHGIDVAGVGSLRLTRPAAGIVSAASAPELLALLGANESASLEPVTLGSGVVALLIPLPHAAHALTAIAIRPDTEATPDSLDREAVPRVDQIERGWAAHLGSSPSFVSAVARRDAVHREAMADVLLGPSWGEADAIEVATVAEALGRIGRVDLSEPLEVLLRDQRANGSFASADPFATTVQFVRAVGASWSGGVSHEIGDRLLAASALSAHWLNRRRNRSAVAAAPNDVSFALESIIGLAEDVGELDMAERFRARCVELGVGSPLTGLRSDELVSELGAGLAFGYNSVPSAAASAQFVIRSASELVADRADAVDLYPGYVASLAGNDLDIESVPTRWGILSFSLRWHGRRPAVLWEMTPWSQRSAVRPFALTCSAIDPTWRSTDRSGEALLAEPAEADFETPPEMVPDHLLSSSSDGHLHGDWNAVPEFDNDDDIPSGGTFS